MKRFGGTLLGALLLIAGCAEGRHPDRQFQICLEDQNGVEAFRQILVSVAERHKLQFFDESLDEEKRLQAMAPDTVGMFPLQAFHVHDEAQGVEITASNFTLGRYQTSISWDLRNAEQRAIAGDLESALSEKFVLRPFPKGSGALPLKDCPN